MVTKSSTSLSQCDNFRVCCRIMVHQVFVPPSTYDLSLTDNYRPHGHLSYFQRSLGRSEGLLHPKLIMRRQNCLSQY